MQYVNLGKTGMKVSRLCLGCMGFGTAEGWTHNTWALNEEDSRVIVKKALELDEDSAECWFALGDAEYHLDNYAAAEAAYQKVVQLEPENKDIWLEYSHLLMVDNRQAEAIELLENGLVYHPEDAELLYRMVCYHYSTGRIQEAYQLLEAALDKNVDLCHTLFEYAPSLEKDRNIVELIDLYKKRL